MEDNNNSNSNSNNNNNNNNSNSNSNNTTPATTNDRKRRDDAAIQTSILPYGLFETSASSDQGAVVRVVASKSLQQNINVLVQNCNP